MNLNRLTILSLLLFIRITPLSAQSLPVNTTWEGRLMNLRIILRLSEDSLTKQKTASFDVPDQSVLGLKVTNLIVTNDSLDALVATLQCRYTAAFNADKTELSGNWKQGGATVPLVLKRTANVDAYAAYKRPQMPKAPFPYQEEKIIYFNKDKSIQYGATLTIPNAAKNVPAVILITGSGSEDRDETIFGHKLFWVIADHLTRNGIAVLRVDDRGVGQTTGNVYNATSADFAKDVLVGVDYLKAHKGIDVKKIGLIGHSEGGMIAPLAANQSADVAFIISMAGVGVKGVEIWKAQSRSGYTKMGLTTDELNRMDSFTDMMVKLSKLYTDNAALKEAFKTAMTDWLKQQPEALLLKVRFKGPGSDQNIAGQAKTMFAPWMSYFLNYDPATTLTKIKIPVLAMNGGKDVQVNATANLAGFKTLLTQAGNKNFKTVLLPNLNHLFQNAITGEGTEYASIEETISPEALDIMTKWILSLKPLQK